MPLPLLLRDVDDGTEPVIVLRPIHDRDIAWERPGRKQSGIDHAAVAPQGKHVPSGEKRIFHRFQRPRLRRKPAELFFRPERRLIITPKLIITRLLDGIIFTLYVIDGEAMRNRLHIHRHRRTVYSMRLARISHTFRAGHILYPGE